MRLDTGDAAQGTGVPCTADTERVVRNGKQVANPAGGSALRRLVGGACVQPVEPTVAALRQTKVDLVRVTNVVMSGGGGGIPCVAGEGQATRGARGWESSGARARASPPVSHGRHVP